MKGKLAVLIVAFSLTFSGLALPVTQAASGIPSQAIGLALAVIPPKLPADGNSYPAAVVSLVDSNGLPSAALTPITVYLTSSQTNIVSVPDTVTIPAGAEYAIASATTTSTPGSAMITASSHGLNTATFNVETDTPSGYPSKLRVLVSPSTLLRRSDTGTVRVEVVDDTGKPSKAINPINVLLSSSNGSIASLGTTTLTIPDGQIYTSATFQTSVRSGQAVITASSTGFASGGAVVTVVPPNYCASNCGPSRLLLKLVPGNLPTGGAGYDALEVGLANTASQPAVSASDTIVQLFSDKPGVVSVPDFVTIPAGQISVLATLTTSALEGHASITASSADLLPGDANVTTTIPAPSKLQAYVAPASTFASALGNYPILVVQLQDSSGNPARARTSTTIIVTSSNGSMVSTPIALNIPVGDDYVQKLLPAVGSGQSMLTATSQGLVTSQVQLQMSKSPLVVSLTTYLPPKGFIWTNESLYFTFSATFLGKPLASAPIVWTGKNGTMAPNSGTTTSGGYSYSTFTPTQPGKGNVTISATSPQTGTIYEHYLFTIVQAPPLPTPSLLTILKNLWWVIVIIIVAVAIALYYFFRLRRKKQRAEIEAGFEVV